MIRVDSYVRRHQPLVWPSLVLSGYNGNIRRSATVGCQAAQTTPGLFAGNDLAASVLGRAVQSGLLDLGYDCIEPAEPVTACTTVSAWTVSA